MAAALCAPLVGCQAFPSTDVNSLPSNTDEFWNRFYTGASFGQGRLNSETEGTDLRVESASALGTQLRLGYDFHNKLAFELDNTLLGASALGEANTGVEYTAATFSALIYGFGGTQMRSRREGLSSYVRVGYGLLNIASVIDDFDFSGTVPVPVLGLGAEYGFANGFGVRTEITRFDSDVSYVGIGAIFRFGKSGDRFNANSVQATAERVPAKQVDESPKIPMPALAVESPETLLSNKNSPVAQVDLPGQELSQSEQLSQGSLADRWRPTKRSDDSDSDGVLDVNDACPTTMNFVTVGSDGCGLFDQVLEDVTFKKGSRVLGPAARSQLDWVADTLLAFPESRIKIKAHTDSAGPVRLNQRLSSHRAKVVSQYLRSRGVNQTQLLSVGMGEAVPIASNDTDAGRLKNRRIELLTLPDLDADQFAVELPTLQAIVKKPLVVAKLSTSSSLASGRPIENDHLKKEELISNSANPQPTVQSEKIVASSEKIDKEPAMMAAEVVPLPVPGYYAGLNIAGIIKGVDFEPVSDVLTDSGRAALEPIARVLLDKPLVAIAVMAHTDDLNDELDNEKLTLQQAEAVIEYLVAAGIDRERLQAEGYGELLPLVQNLTDEDRARNRRIEIRILPSRTK
jgi:outer membrane protein OmpA-like peptidoglycan-associated protein